MNFLREKHGSRSIPVWKLLLCLCAAAALTGCHQHEWSEASCLDPSTCGQCGETTGEALGHDWTQATCAQPKTCQRCGETEGTALEHIPGQWVEAAAATCTSAGSEESACTLCGEVLSREVKQLEHQPSGEWVVTTPAVGIAEGTRVQYCTLCGETAVEEQYQLSAEEQEVSFKNDCDKYTYDEIARNPKNYVLRPAVFTGQVIQVMEDGNDYTLRVNVTRGKYSWSDTLYVEYTQEDSSEGRILEDDIITIYGFLTDTVTYTTVLGSSVTIPSMLARYIEFN